MQKRPIIIQGALQSEIDLLLEAFTPHTKREIGGFLFYECDYRGTPVVISKTKMGEVCAAIATTLAIEHYRPAWILNQGTAGALAKDLHTGDVIVGDRVVYLSQFATKRDKEEDRLNPWKSGEYRTLDGERISLKTDERLFAWLKSLSFSVKGSLRYGTLGSGDVWTTEREQINAYHERFEILCESMECTGVYMAANSQGVPAVSVRVISNNELLGESYLPESGKIAECCAKFPVDAWIDLGEKTPF
ncbi:MAG: 5'-methylthioadenosine/S-adenosylhomocysteine nucleosidase [Clostridia bacterium]|nr:5'-methylthioadenosine/S-adenosylhomocysteine nucleosidase [Clostridia bacterium]